MWTIGLKTRTIILCSITFAFFKLLGYFEPNYRVERIEEEEDVGDFKAFITSSYYYPKSQSLGDNALAIVMNINQKRRHWFDKTLYEIEKKPLITIRAINLTSTKIITTSYERITLAGNKCLLPSVFLTVQLLPNTLSVEFLGDNQQNSVAIPFSIPPTTKYDVVVCITPIFVAENWQSFLFAMHIYKKFGAFVNLYYISSIDSFFDLIRIYEDAGYLTIQPWVTIKMIGVDKNELDAFQQVEFRNQAASQTDCILKYKETAKFVACLDMDDILIPKLAPTFIGEFNILLKNAKENSYLIYPKQDYYGLTVNNFNNFSVSSMFQSLEQQNCTKSGKIVTDPRMINYTWIHWTYQKVRRIKVQENKITHLKKLEWLESFPKSNKSSNISIMNEMNMLKDIEEDWQKMQKKVDLKKPLPKEQFYAKVVGDCYMKNYYSYISAESAPPFCSGPHYCEYPQRSDIKCVHSDARYDFVPQMSPITYYFAVHPRFNSSYGCYS
ncbi:unnamed protein product [Caenorhabditis angaria]|uniref:Glycosyltransferase family 92 protein n=1 Tax=Caenorhabditis angaria TaxID=860376 RepID=A0A9P1IQD1_9PELO|nr:unnamed protein product [Caenorhabditis angaria]